METPHLQRRPMPHEVMSVEKKSTTKKKDGTSKAKNVKGNTKKKGRKDFPDYFYIATHDEEDETEKERCERCITFQQTQFCMTCEVSLSTGRRLPASMHPCMYYDGDVCSECELELD